MTEESFTKFMLKLKEEAGYSQEILDNLFQEYQKKTGSLIVKILFYKRLTEIYLCYGQIQPIIGDNTLQDETLEYDNFCYFQRVVPFKEIEKQLQYLIRPKAVNGSNRSSFSFYGLEFCSTTWSTFEKVEQRPYWYEDYKIPSYCRLIFSLRYPSPSISHNEKLFTKKIDLPYFPTVRELIKSKFSLNPERVSLNNTIHIALTSLDGYIHDLNILDDKIIINIVNEGDSPLILKVYGEDKENKPITLNYEIENSQEIAIEGQFTKMDILLINKDGLTLDQRIYDIEQKSSQDEIKELIENGENENIEFKRWVEKLEPIQKEKRKKRYVKLISALANAQGGTILVGVDDSADIKGTTKKELDQICNFIQNINDELLTPNVTIKMDHVDIDAKIIGVFQVKKSDSIILNRVDKRNYVRKGSTNRVMQPKDILDFIEDRRR